VRGIFEIGDPNFGNLWTNIPRSLFEQAGFAYGDTLKLSVWNEGKLVFSQRVSFQPSFGYAPRGDVVIYNTN
jgi:S-adenosylmethionine hydrolase